VGVWRDAGEPDGRAVDVRGVARLGEGGRWRELVTDAPVQLPAVVRVRRAGSAEVVLARGISVRVDGPATVRLDARTAQVDAGRALHRVAPGHGRWVVQLGDYRVVVRGTQFWTARAGGGRVPRLPARAPVGPLRNARAARSTRDRSDGATGRRVMGHEAAPSRQPRSRGTLRLGRCNGGRSWEVIVEPDEASRRTVVVTAYALDR
jgi:hypothetical protein